MKKIPVDGWCESQRGDILDPGGGGESGNFLSKGDFWCISRFEILRASGSFLSLEMKQLDMQRQLRENG